MTSRGRKGRHSDCDETGGVSGGGACRDYVSLVEVGMVGGEVLRDERSVTAQARDC